MIPGAVIMMCTLKSAVDVAVAVIVLYILLGWQEYHHQNALISQKKRVYQVSD